MFDGGGFGRRDRWPAVAVAVGLCGSGSGAAAQAAGQALAKSGKVQLVYRLPKKPAGCDAETTFRHLASVGPKGGAVDPFALTGPPASVLEVTLSAAPDGFRGVVELRDTSGETLLSREIFQRSCADVIDHVLLIALGVLVPKTPPPPPPALEYDPYEDVSEIKARLDRLEEKTEALDDTNAVLKKQIADLVKTNTELAKALEAEKNKMNLTYTLATGFLLTANLTSNAGPGVWLGGDARSGPLSLGLELRAVLPSRVVVGPNDFDLSQFVGLLTPCGRVSYLFGCGVAGAGVQLATDTDYLSPSSATQTQPVVQLGGRLGVELPFAENRFAVRGWADVLYSTPKTSLSYYPDLRFDRPDVSAFFGLGFVVKLGQEEGAK